MRYIYPYKKYNDQISKIVPSDDINLYPCLNYGSLSLKNLIFPVYISPNNCFISYIVTHHSRAYSV